MRALFLASLLLAGLVTSGWLVAQRISLSPQAPAEPEAAAGTPEPKIRETEERDLQGPAPAQPAAELDTATRALAKRAEEARVKGDQPEEALALSRWVAKILESNSDGWQKTTDSRSRIAVINTALWFAPKGTFRSEFVEPGPLSKILKALRTRKPAVRAGLGLVMKMNQISDANRVPGGRKLRVPVDSLEVIVHKNSKALELRLGEYLLECWRIGIGKPVSPTPTGSFEIQEIVKLDVAERSATRWVRPEDGRELFFGDPEYPFGTRFLRFSEPYQHYGIHGTDTDAAIGAEISHGCVRMRNEDVAELASYLDSAGAARFQVHIH
ncbi:MAG: L,D-transpeptidase [Planctomycetes bacterium]|nr:L,D-transpeptidase [Planctomycetota bacterium]